MDMTPPQAPPPAQAGTTVAETARSALTRLDESGRWLKRQPGLMPEWSHPQGDETIDTYLAALATHWSGSDAELGLPRTQALAHHIAQIMRDEASLRIVDGTLDERARTIVGELVTARAGDLPAAVHASEVLVGGVAFAGALVARHDHVPGITLLFLPNVGWQAFESDRGVIAHLRQRLDLSDDPLRIRGIASDDVVQAMLDGDVAMRSVARDVFGTLARRVVEVQNERITLAWDDYTLDKTDTTAVTDLADGIRDILRVGGLYDVDALLDLREARLVEAIQHERMAHAPDHVRKAWQASLEAYNEALLDTATLRQAVGLTEPDSIRSHAMRLLGTRLAALGIQVDPSNIVIEITAIPRPNSPTDMVGAWTGNQSKRRITLLELSYEGIGRHQLDGFRAVANGDGSAPVALTSSAIRDMIRDVDLSTRYQAYLDTVFRDGPRGAAAKALALHLQQARMRFEAEDARLAYYLPDASPGFIFDREERGYLWVDAALGQRSAAQRQSIGGHAIDAIQLTYKGAPLTDVLVFASRQPQSAPRVVMYTPDAPDGITFREFADRQEAARKFLYHPAFREYLLDRLPAEFTLVRGGQREFAGDKRAHWILGASGNAAYTLTEEPFAEQVVHGDFLDAAYDGALELRKRNARLVARSRAEADRDAILHHPLADLPLSPGARFAATTVVEIPASAIRAVQASWRFYDHVRAGDHGEAFVAFTESYTSALNVVTPGILTPARRVPSIRPTPGARSLVSANLPATPPPPAFESRYIAHGLNRTRTVGPDGFHHIGARRYVEQDGYLYAVRFDDHYQCWRLTKPEGSLDTAFTGPAIERVNGQWRYANDVGLRGGMRRHLRDRFRSMLRLDNAEQAAAPAQEAAAAAPEAPAFYLPPQAEHLRARLTAAMDDNPRAHTVVYNDGSGFHMRPPAHHQILFGEGLSPDVAALSIHQRRVLLHELENRFASGTRPGAADLAAVIDELGIARGGRRVPSPSRPGRAPRGDDGQVPEISSSSGDEVVETLGPSTLRADQRERWNEALALAQASPRVSPRAPSPPSASAPRVTAEPLPRAEWPERVWLYTNYVPAYSERGAVHVGIAPRTVRRSATEQNRFQVLTLPPETAPGLIDDALGIPLERRATPEGRWTIWVEIDTRLLRDERAPQGHAYDIYPRVNDPGGARYSLRSWFHHLRLQPGGYRMGMRRD